MGGRNQLGIPWHMQIVQCMNFCFELLFQRLMHYHWYVFYTVITNNHLENFYHEFLPCWDSSWSCRHDWQVPAPVRQVLCQWQQTAPNFCVQANSATELWAANREWGIKISSISFSILSTKFEIKKARLISDI